MSDAHAHDHPPHLAHHFDTEQQQFDSAKLGMWVFLATEILMFGGLFCAYAIYRGNNPDVFMFAHKALDTNWGAINTVVLLASSFTMAWGVRASQLGQNKLLMIMLLLTLLGGGGFMLVKTIEYQSKYDHNLWVGGINAFNPTATGEEAEAIREHATGYIESKAHPDGGEGHNGHSEGHGEEPHPEGGHESHPPAEDGHAPADGGHTPGEEHGGPVDDGAAHPAGGAIAEVEAAAPAAMPEPTVMAASWPPTPKAEEVSKTMVAPIGSVGIVADFTAAAEPKTTTQILGLPQSPGHSYPRHGELTSLERKRAHIFFQIYFLMTGLHGLHVLIGMSLIFWVMYRAGSTQSRAWILPFGLALLGAYAVFVWIRLEWTPSLITGIVLLAAAGAWAFLRIAAAKKKEQKDGEFGPRYYTPVDLVGLYWHLVDLIWIFLFPLLYLIH